MMNATTRFLILFLACLLSAAHGQSQSEMNEQARKNFEKVDARLNSVYKKLIATLDSESQVKLKAAQRAWIAFRDAEAEFKADLAARGGSMAPMIHSATAADLTEKRLRQLEAALQESAP
ncbi:MAG: lysozyme inhibitor LprI family protein [Verrucomicrobiota bacterium]